MTERIASLKNIGSLLLFLILLTGALLRFHNFADWSLSNDELSALNRLRVSSFSALIQTGVIPDYHPAGIQVFLWVWVKLFGNSPASVRLPFVIAGILSIALIYLLAKKWFSKTTGLLAAAALAFLQFPLLYSRIARPYATGLLVVLALAWFWSAVLMDKNAAAKTRWKNAAGLALGFALCMYNHYYSFFFAAMAGVTGLFFLNKENFRQYFAAGFTAVLLFIPHYSISEIQLARGGLESWLGKPEPEFFGEFFDFVFNESMIVKIIIALLVLLSVILYRKELQHSRYRAFCLLWFFLPLAFGYYYSVYVNPILQYSILLFSFPFLIIFIFSFFTDSKKIISYAAVFLLLGAGTYSTVPEQNFFGKQFFGVFKELAEHTAEENKIKGEKNITSVMNVIHPWYLDYYFDRLNAPRADFYLHGNDPAFGKKLLKIVNESSAPYFIYGWSNNYSPPEAEWIIMKKYYLSYTEPYFNSAVSFFKNDGAVPPMPPGFYEKNDFESGGKWGDSEKQQVSSEKSFSGSHSIRLDSTQEFSAGVTFPVSKLHPGKNTVLTVSARINLPDTSTGSMLVISFESGGKAYDWHGIQLRDWMNAPGQWEEVFAVRKIKNPPSANAVCKIYIWNSSKKIIYADDFVIAEYGNFQP
jgi:hypothetical protein